MKICECQARYQLLSHWNAKHSHCGLRTMMIDGQYHSGNELMAMQILQAGAEQS